MTPTGVGFSVANTYRKGLYTCVMFQDGSHVMGYARGVLSNGLRCCGAGLGTSRWSPAHDSTDGVNGCKEEGERSADEGPAFSLHSQEGDTEAPLLVGSLHPTCSNTHMLVKFPCINTARCTRFIVSVYKVHSLYIL